ncbi:MAG: proton-conducting transporter membrane subunit, partial [Lautropia sp.]
MGRRSTDFGASSSPNRLLLRWMPDIYEGANPPVAALAATISRGAVLALMLRYFVSAGGYQSAAAVLALTWIAITSMLAGNLLALLQSAPTINDPNAMVALVNANAIVGIVARDSNGDGKLDITRGDKVSVACTICHTITDKSVFDMPNGGSVGRRVDGPAALTLNVGKLLAMAANSLAFYPNLQHSFMG